MKKAYSAGVLPAALLGFAGMIGVALAQDTPTSPVAPGAEAPAGATTPSTPPQCVDLIAHLREDDVQAQIQEDQRSSVEQLLTQADQELTQQNESACMDYVNQAYQQAGIEVPTELPQAQ